MAVMSDYKCDLHGFFESTEAVCPEGCTENIMKVFLQPFNLKSDKTKSNDKTLDNLAQDFKMTDIKSTREGDTQSNYLTRNNAPPQPEARPGDAVMWGNAGQYNLDSLLKGGVVKPVRDESVGFAPNQAGNLSGPKAASYIADHENLKVDKNANSGE